MSDSIEAADEGPAGRTLLDAGAAIWAALVSAVVFALLCTVVLGSMTSINAWVAVRLFASPLLGEGVLAPPATYDAAALAAGGALLLVLGFALALLLSVTIHRFGLLFGVIGGALYGLVIYVGFVHVASMAWPYFATLQGSAFAIVCVIFGAFAGGLYEWLEVETFELDEETH